MTYSRFLEYALPIACGVAFGMSPSWHPEQPAPAPLVVHLQNPGPYPTEQRSWADLFAACRLVDSWLGADADGKPVCYPMHQAEVP